MQRLVAEELFSMSVCWFWQAAGSSHERAELTEALRLNTLREGLNWHVQETVATEKKGVAKELWLSGLPSVDKVALVRTHV